MLISYSWLQLLTKKLDENPYEIAEKLSRSIAEIENITVTDLDTVFEVENKALSHRADLFGHVGWAHEIAAITGKSVTQNLPKDVSPCGTIAKNSPLTISIDDSDEKATRYVGAVVDLTNQPQSPAWLVDLLTALGQRSVSYIVDITNYVMLKHAQPMHAFDVAKLPSLNISVRFAQEGERLTLLDNTELTLTTSDLVIDSGGVAIALAGIKGGNLAQIDQSTNQILLESATFDQYTIRATSRRHAVRSEASLRFEKGLSPTVALTALREALTILTGDKDISDSSYVDCYPNPIELSEPIAISIDSVRHYLNKSDLRASDIVSKLELLGFITKNENNDILVTPPHERNDIHIVEDVYEEIGRVLDYNTITPTLPQRDASIPNRNDQWEFGYAVRDVFARTGNYETLSYSFVDKNAAGQVSSISEGVSSLEPIIDPSLVAIKNPAAPEMAYMRTSLLPSITSHVIENAKRFDEFGLFEIGKVTVPHDETLPDEPRLLAFTYYSKKESEVDTLSAGKGIWKTSLTYLGITNELVNLVPLKLEIGETKGFCFGYEIDLDVLQSLSIPRMFSQIPVSMPTINDLSFTLPADQIIGPVISHIIELGSSNPDITMNCVLTDQFQSPTMKKENRMSYTVRLTFSHLKQSLSDTKITPLRTSIEKSLATQFNAIIR